MAWPAVASVALASFCIVAILLLRAEARQLGITLWSRMCLVNPGWKIWLLAVGVLMIGNGSPTYEAELPVEEIFAEVDELLDSDGVPGFEALDMMVPDATELEEALILETS